MRTSYKPSNPQLVMKFKAKARTNKRKARRTAAAAKMQADPQKVQATSSQGPEDEVFEHEHREVIEDETASEPVRNSVEEPCMEEWRIPSWLLKLLHSLEEQRSEDDEHEDGREVDYPSGDDSSGSGSGSLASDSSDNDEDDEEDADDCDHEEDIYHCRWCAWWCPAYRAPSRRSWRSQVRDHSCRWCAWWCPAHGP
jgi:hypothetical protein